MAQNSIESYINDKDGFANVRQQKTSDSEIITIIKNAELFVCQPNPKSNWWKIKTKSGISGYLHNSRIVTVEDQSNKISELFNKIATADPNNAEFSEGSNQLLFMYVERFPKSFLLAFDKTDESNRKIILTELESPIQDGINVELIYEQLSSLEVNIPRKEQVVKALLTAARKHSKSAISH